MNPVFAGLPTTIFEATSALARETGAINLGQGFPDDPGPRDVRECAAQACLDGSNQYPPMMGAPALRQAIADHYGRWQGVALDAETQTLVTSGATEALAAALLAVLQPGDEAVLFQPMYDSYLPIVRLAGAVARFVRLRPPHWRFDDADLKAAFNDRTRAVVFNNPLNPCGVAYPREDLALLARYCERFGAVAICDEVWEHVIFDGRRHEPLIAIPGMEDRAIKIGSAGKIFSLTGWKVGFVMAAPALLGAVAKAHQYLAFTTPPNLQAAVAYGLGKEDAYFAGMRFAFQRSRDRLSEGLRARGYRALESQGTYFLTIDLGEGADDVAWCQALARERGVAAIPVSAFYAQDPVRSIVRLCFAKTDATLDAALDRLGPRA